MADLDFTDDVVLASEEAKDQEELTQRVNKEASRIRLHINTEKTIVMGIGNNSHDTKVTIEEKNRTGGTFLIPELQLNYKDGTVVAAHRRCASCVFSQFSQSWDVFHDTF